MELFLWLTKISSKSVYNFWDILHTRTESQTLSYRRT